MTAFRFELCDLPPAAEALRGEVRAFLAEELAGHPAARRAYTWMEADRDFSRKVGARGWLGMTWPKRYGGHERFTVGQRRGLGVGSGKPLYVLSKDPSANRVVVGTRDELATTRVEVRAARLHRPAATVDRVKLRYRSEPVPCRVEAPVASGAHDRLTLLLDRAVDGAAPGQTACLMHDEAVVGAAVIAGASGDDRDVHGEVRGETASSERERAHVG